MILKCQIDKIRIRKDVLAYIKASVFKSFGHALEIVEKTSKKTQMHFLNELNAPVKMGTVILRSFSLLKNSDFLVSALLVLRCVQKWCSEMPAEMSRPGSLFISLYPLPVGKGMLHFSFCLWSE